LSPASNTLFKDLHLNSQPLKTTQNIDL
jgi:hypothetical protein